MSIPAATTTGVRDIELTRLPNGVRSRIHVPRAATSSHHTIEIEKVAPPILTLLAKTDLAEISVVTDSALRGEVYAKCAMLMGAAAGIAFLEARGVHYALVPAITAGDGMLPAAA